MYQQRQNVFTSENRSRIKHAADVMAKAALVGETGTSTPSYTMFLGPKVSQPQTGPQVRAAVFAGCMNMTDRQTYSLQTDTMLKNVYFSVCESLLSISNYSTLHEEGQSSTAVSLDGSD